MKLKSKFRFVKFDDGFLLVDITEKNYGKDKNVLLLNESTVHIIELLCSNSLDNVVEILMDEQDNVFSRKEIEDNIFQIISALTERGVIEDECIRTSTTYVIEKIGFGPIKNRLATQRRPLVGVVELTPKCNCNCPHCYVKGFTGDNWLSTNQFIQIAAILKEKGILNVTLTGGEPLSHPDFKEIYTAYKEAGFLIDIFSNALLIDDKMADLLTEYPPRSIDVTLYGLSDDDYYRFTGVKDGFSKLCYALDLLSSKGIFFTTKMILHQGNYDKIDEYNKFALEYNAPFRYNVIIGAGNNTLTNPDEIALSKEQIINIEKQDPLRKAVFSTLASKCSNLPFDCNGSEWSQFPCGAGLDKVFIGYDGKMSPCMTLRDRGLDLFIYGYDAIWEYWGDERKKLLQQNCECITCKYMPICTPCTAEFKKINGDCSIPIKSRCDLVKSRWEELIR